jgi:biotin carboxylase
LCADRKDFAQFMQKNGRPIVAKLRQGSGSRGIHFLHQDDFSPDHWDSYLFEKFVHGPELSVESFIVGGEVCFTNVTEYYRKAHVNLLPRPLDPDLRAHLMSLNQAVIDGLKISRGMSHAEFYLSPEGLVFGEVALRPPGGYIMELMAMSYQIDPWLCLLHAEVDESPIELRKLVERARPEAHYVAAYVVHPGEGTIASIQGLEAVENHPAVMSIKLKAVAGDHISARLGLGMDCGVAFLKHSSYLGLTQAIDEITQTLEFSMTVKQKLLK